MNRLVATVDGEPITQHQVDGFIRSNSGGMDPASVSDADRRRVLDLLITDLKSNASEPALRRAPAGPGV